jgi:hypothetical protein
MEGKMKQSELSSDQNRTTQEKKVELSLDDFEFGEPEKQKMMFSSKDEGGEDEVVCALECGCDGLCSCKMVCPCNSVCGCGWTPLT